MLVPIGDQSQVSEIWYKCRGGDFGSQVDSILWPQGMKISS